MNVRVSLPPYMRRDGRSVRVALTCAHTLVNERGMSDCAHGCKVFACNCGAHRDVVHNATYGCRNDTVSLAFLSSVMRSN